jgi:hypothetical protein
MLVAQNTGSGRGRWAGPCVGLPQSLRIAFLRGTGHTYPHLNEIHVTVLGSNEELLPLRYCHHCGQNILIDYKYALNQHLTVPLQLCYSFCSIFRYHPLRLLVL